MMELLVSIPFLVSLLIVLVLVFSFGIKKEYFEIDIGQSQKKNDEVEHGLDTLVKDVTVVSNRPPVDGYAFIEGDIKIQPRKKEALQLLIEPYNVWYLQNTSSITPNTIATDTQKKTIGSLSTMLSSQNDVGIIIDSSIPILDPSIYLLPGDKNESSPSWNIVPFDHINQIEVQLLIDLLLNYINSLYEVKRNEYSYSMLLPKEGIKSITMKTQYIDSTIVKNMDIKGFIYEKKSNFTQFINIVLEVRHPYKKNGILTIKKFTDAANIDRDNGLNVYNTPILPALNEKLPDKYRKEGLPLQITNELGLLYPYTTSASNALVTEDDYIAQEQRLKLLEKLNSEYSCYGTMGTEQLNTKEDCNSQGGVWDRPVDDPYQCPYYLKNKNYTNSRGGTKFGYCEMPLNVQIKGFRYIDRDPRFKPFCYNCKTNLVGQGSLGTCCDTQTSPDYAYPGDKLDRGSKKQELINNGLSVL
ncbi:hypothetical protein CCP3SC1AL1_690015 [Gammaproteobacteria bacterium]